MPSAQAQESRIALCSEQVVGPDIEISGVKVHWAASARKGDAW